MLLRQFRYNREPAYRDSTFVTPLRLEIYATLSALPPLLNPSPSEHHE